MTNDRMTTYRTSCLPMAVCLAMLPSVASIQTSRQTIRMIQPRMVKIFGAGGIRGLHAYGTGFLVSPKGHIATVWSHVLDADSITVVLNDGRRFQARVLGAKPQLDLAVLKLQAENVELSYFDIEQTASVGPGTRILAFSNMFNVATGDEPVSVLHGVIAARTNLSTRRGTFEIPYDGPIYVVDAITNNSGAAGGVLTTQDGQLLAMIGKELRNARSNTWVNYAIPIGELKEAIKQITNGNFVAHKKKPDETEIPVRYHPLDFGLVMVPDVLYRTPAYVDSVLPNSQAARAGLRSDDLVLFVNDELIQSCRTLKVALGRLESGDALRLIVRRANQLVQIKMNVKK